MFNGIIYNQGIVTKIIKRPKGLNIFVKSNLKVSKKDMGLSVACDGVCLTLISFKSKLMEFYLSKETLVRSKFQYLKTKDVINLELPLKYGTKISGHICQGHVVERLMGGLQICFIYIKMVSINNSQLNHIVKCMILNQYLIR